MVAALLVLHSLATPSAQAEAHRAGGEGEEKMSSDGGPVLGGVEPVGNENDLHLVDLARFAVTEHNKKAVSAPLYPPPYFSSSQGRSSN